MTKREVEKTEAREQLLKLLKPGDTVLCVLEHVSRSGMSRRIKLYVQGDPGQEPIYLAGYAGKLLGLSRGKGDGLKIGGCGMDMGFALVYELSHALWPEGFVCLGDHCPANDHHNSPYPAKVAGSMVHKTGGYALRHRWL